MYVKRKEVGCGGGGAVPCLGGVRDGASGGSAGVWFCFRMLDDTEAVSATPEG